MRSTTCPALRPSACGFPSPSRNISAAFLSPANFRGGSIADLIRREGPLRPDQAVGMVLQALDGLHYAHGSTVQQGRPGSVHRDIEPSDLLLAGSAGEASGEGRGLRAGQASTGRAVGIEHAAVRLPGTMPFMPSPAGLIRSNPLQSSDVDVWGPSPPRCLLDADRSVPRDFPRGQDPIRVASMPLRGPIRERDPNIPNRLGHGS